jgi:hypothetical protein
MVSPQFWRVLALEPTNIQHLRGTLEPIDPGSSLDERALRIVPDIYREAGPHGVLGRPPGALEVATLESDLGYVRIVEGMPDLSKDLPRGSLEVHGD